MIDSHNVARLVGSRVVDPEGGKIGTIGRIYVDPAFGLPTWMTVKSGIFGTRTAFVPLDDAKADGDGDVLSVPYTQRVVKDSPHVENDDALTDAEQERLRAYYRGPGRHDSAGSPGEDLAPRRADLDDSRSD